MATNLPSRTGGVLASHNRSPSHSSSREGNIPESSSYGSHPSTSSTNSTQSTIKEMLDQRGYLHCVLQQNWDGEWVIRAVGEQQEERPPATAGAGAVTPGAGAGGRPTWAGPFSGEVVPPPGSGGTISPRDYVNLLHRMTILNKDRTDLSMRMCTLYIPSPDEYGLHLFDDDRSSKSGNNRESEWVVLTSGANRAYDDWGHDLPPGYKLRPGIGGSSRRGRQSGDYYDNVISEILYPQDTDPSTTNDLPRFVLPIGRVGLRYKDHRKLPKGMAAAATSVSSYIVAMNVAAPAKPLWLVHDAYTTTADVEFPDERQPAPSLSLAGFEPFDVAPLADSIGEWGLGDGGGGDGHGGSVTPTADIGLNLGQVRERIMKRGSLVKPLFSMTWHSRVVEAVREGYESN